MKRGYKDCKLASISLAPGSPAPSSRTPAFHWGVYHVTLFSCLATNIQPACLVLAQMAPMCRLGQGPRLRAGQAHHRLPSPRAQQPSRFLQRWLLLPAAQSAVRPGRSSCPAAWPVVLESTDGDALALCQRLLDSPTPYWRCSPASCPDLRVLGVSV